MWNWCISGAGIYSGSQVCRCPSGQYYTGNSCASSPTLEFSSAVLFDDKMKVTVNASPSTCLYLFKGSSTVSYFTVCNNGSTDLTLAAIASNVGTDKFAVGDRFKLCLSIDRT